MHRLKKILKQYLQKKVNSEHIVKNINIDITRTNQPKILICYLDYKCLYNLKNIKHSQYIEFATIIKYFINRGYIIDISSCSYKEIENIDDDYDYILGLGFTFRMAVQKNKSACSILWLTENPPNISMKMEKERIDYYYNRHKKKVVVERSGTFFIQSDLDNADYVVFMCEKGLISANHSFQLHPTGLKNNSYIPDFSCKKPKTFMWFGGPAAIHKGLDICIDVFTKHPDWKLYVAGVSKQKVKKYKLDIKHSNIVFLEFLDINSERYKAIVNETSFMIMPSCSEATSTAVLTSMRHGLIPIVCKLNGFEDFKDKIIILDDYHVDYVEKKIEELLNEYNTEKIVTMSKNIMKFADTYFSMERFKKDIGLIFNQIVIK